MEESVRMDNFYSLSGRGSKVVAKCVLSREYMVQGRNRIQCGRQLWKDESVGSR